LSRKPTDDLGALEQKSETENRSKLSRKTTDESTKSGQFPQVPVGAAEDFEPYTWLSDAGIAFASACLAASGKSSLSSKGRKFPKNVMFMDPAMAFWLTMQDDPKHLQDAKVDMKLQELDLILCPINDAHSTCTADAGCHWSLLACWGNRPAGMRGHDRPGPFSHFRFYDSLGGLFAEKGKAQAAELVNRLTGQALQLETGSCSQQKNFYDCGVYVLLFSEIIATAFVDAQKRGEGSHMISPSLWEERLLSLTPQEADACRTHYHNLAREITDS
jgi:hypothetical protein